STARRVSGRRITGLSSSWFTPGNAIAGSGRSDSPRTRAGDRAVRPLHSTMTPSRNEQESAVAAKPIGPYTPVVRAGDWIVTSGQIGAVDGTIVAGGLRAELRQAIENVDELLRGEGAGLADVVKTTVFLRHMSDYAVMNE